MRARFFSSFSYKFLTALVVCVIVLAALLVTPAHAATITVTTTSDETTTNGACSLREAIINANDDLATQPDCPAGTGADIIILTSGSPYILSLVGNTATTGDLDITDVDGLTIQASGAAPAIIDANGIERVIDVSAGNLTVDTLTITNGTTPAASSNGGGIRFAGTGTLTVTNSTVSNNVGVDTAGCGGGIYNNSTATVNIINSTIANNTCNNATGDGGGVWKGFGGNLNITNSVISGNSTGDQGGGVRFSGGGTLTITDSTISGNSSASTAACGGGIHNDSAATVNIISSTIANNTCTGLGSDGGGLWKGTGGALNITNSTFYGNSTNDNGGGARITAGTANILFSTFSNNSIGGAAGSSGGGLQIQAAGTNVTITSTILANNTPHDCDQAGGAIVTLNNTLIEVDIDCGVESFNTDPGLGPLANNGGPTQTMAITPGSVAFNAATGCIATDQRGISRPQGVACDLGAYEYDDTIPPDTIITANPPDPDNNPSPVFSFTGTDPGGSGVASFECQIDGGGFAACTSGSTFGPLADGPHTFEVRAIDVMGNVDPTPASYTWTIDTIPPDTIITANPPDPDNNPSPVFSFTGNDGLGTGIASFECQIDGGGFSVCTSGSTFGPLVDGLHTFEVRAIDNAGNVDPTPASYTWTIDVAIPTVTINQAVGQADPTNASPINFTVIFSEPVTGFVTGDVTLSGTAGATTATVTGGPTTYNVAVSGMTVNGTVIASIGAGVAVDASNNPNTASTSTDNTVTYNTSLPETVINSNPSNPSNSADATFTFSSPDVDVVGFECQLDGSSFASCTTPLTYTGLSSGSHTFEVRAIDAAGNVDPTPASYTWLVDLGYPIVVSSLPTNNATISPGPTQITVTFNEDVKNDGSAGAANNIANYLLVEDGANGSFDTTSCAGGFLADDTLVAIDSASYTNNGGGGPYVATININGGVQLSEGTYRLFVCGTTSIEDLSDNELNNGLSDAIITFTVTAPPGDDTEDGQARATLLPVTGFPLNRITNLPAQPSDKVYTATELWLEIPRFGAKMSIVGVPQTKSGWDTTWLGKEAGWLNGSAFPTWNGNSVLTGHVWDAFNQPGPFARLKDLKYGDQIRIHAFGQVYTFELTENTLVYPSSTSTVFKHADKPTLTLVTCEDYKEASQTYTYRRMVRAVLVSVTNEK